MCMPHNYYFVNLFLDFFYECTKNITVNYNNAS